MATRHIDDMIHLRYQAKAFCKNRLCARVRLDGGKENGILLDLAGFDPDWTIERLQAAMVCSECGTRQVEIVWTQVGQPSVYWTEERDKARAARGRLKSG